MTPEHEALREAIAKALSTVSMTIDQAEAVLAVLPQHAPAVLGILGTVRVESEIDEYGRECDVFVVSLGAAAKEADDE